ncbi:proteasome subunit alpha [Dactylosporangium sp. AC04546]|uniref:proteasome subunit alpha n=1 Tax=Dactylosporangium sp. AC04546 TaxID=2862460 RepID=UPI001EDFAA83|nr:proteasome subunit alpha [Dactylosporangium sp. AC04546]WVK80335.1 proteasome subunit alpha [Dactylosporangium sp. AC04546]
MAMQFYASPEQIMRDRSEYARKGIARGRSVVVLSYEGGVLFVAENLSTALHKVSEIYDRIGFAAVGRYPEFENLRSAGVRLADLHGYSYGRRDVTGRQIANAYARTLGAIFTEQQKPFEVEICVAEVGTTAEDDELYRITYDGSVQDEPGLVTMGGQSDAISGAVKTRFRADQTLAEALKLAVDGLGSVGGEGGQPRKLAANQLEVAVLDRNRPGRTFRRLTGLALTAILEDGTKPAAEAVEPEAGLEDKPQPPASPSTPADNASGPAPSSDDEPAE